MASTRGKLIRSQLRFPPVAVAVALLCLLTPAARADFLFDLAADWSDAANPNGVWSYNAAPGMPLTNHLADYDPGRRFFMTPQPAYAFQPFQQRGHIPAFYRAVAEPISTQEDVPLGRVYLHNNDPANSPPGLENQPAGISWTAPLAGTIEISGGLWQVSRFLGRSEVWTLQVNGEAVSDGLLTFTNGTSASPLDLATGSGGAAALSRSVAAGDVISLEFTRAAGEPFGTYMGVDLSIRLTETAAVPEPSSLLLAGIGLAALAYSQRARALKQKGSTPG